MNDQIANILVDIGRAKQLIESLRDETAAKDARIRELEGHHQRDEELLVQRTAVLTAAQTALRDAEAARDQMQDYLDQAPDTPQRLWSKQRYAREIERQQGMLNAARAQGTRP